MNSNSRLVYSSDPARNQKGPITAVLRIEKSGRGGKTVTVIDRLPKSETFLKELCTELKKKCGSGGTYLLTGPDGVIEIQGDKREMIRDLLSKKGMTVKG